MQSLSFTALLLSHTPRSCFLTHHYCCSQHVSLEGEEEERKGGGEKGGKREKQGNYSSHTGEGEQGGEGEEDEESEERTEVNPRWQQRLMELLMCVRLRPPLPGRKNAIALKDE